MQHACIILTALVLCLQVKSTSKSTSQASKSLKWDSRISRAASSSLRTARRTRGLHRRPRTMGSSTSTVRPRRATLAPENGVMYSP